MKITSRRKLAAAVGISAVAAVVASVLTPTPASAGNAASIAAFGPSHVAADVCAVFTFLPKDKFGNDSAATDQVTVRVVEDPNNATQDLDICVAGGAQNPVNSEGVYFAGDDTQNPPDGSETHYIAGPGATGGDAPTAGGSPDTSDNGAESDTGNFPTCCNDSNPTGADYARYNYQPGSGGVKVGIVGLTPGGAKIQAFFDDASGLLGPSPNNYAIDSGETTSPVLSMTITAGGLPNSTQVTDAVAKIVATPTDDTGTPGAVQSFTTVVTNASGDVLRGVKPSVLVNSGGANPTATPSCDISDNSGVSRCSFTGVNSGLDSLTVYVNRVGGTAGVDPGEKSTVISRTTSRPPVSASEARYITLTPTNQTTNAGQSATFTATITDVGGAPAQGVSVVFTESGPGQFANGSSTTTTTSDATGRAFGKVVTTAGDIGSEQVTATISTSNTQCSQAAGAGNGAGPNTPAGRCADTVTHKIVTAPSPTPTPTNSPTPSPTGSGTRQTLFVSTSTPDIQPTQTGVLNVSGQPGGSVELRCYTRPNTSYFTARGPQNLSSSGAWQFQITPGANTRCYARYTGDDTTASGSVVINVHTTLSLSAVRNGVRTYTFQGRNLPRRAGQLITLYRVDNNGNEIRTSNLTTDSSGIYRVVRKFTGNGTFFFKVRTSKTLNNADGVSNTITVNIH